MICKMNEKINHNRTKIITQKTINSGRPGTKKWVKEYGSDFVCMRYKIDPINKRKLKTIEIIVENKPWVKNDQKVPFNKIVGIKVKYGEVHIGRMVRSVGGKWNRKEKIWELPFGQVQALGLTNRIVTKK